MVEMYNNHYSVAEIARRLYYAKGTVYARLQNAGVKMRPRGHPAGMGTRLNHQEVARTVLLYKNGYTTNEVAQMEGIKQSSVRYRLKMAGVPTRPRSESLKLKNKRLKLVEAQEMANLYESGLSQTEIANMFGWTRPAVKNRLQMLGVKLRSRSEYARLSYRR